MDIAVTAIVSPGNFQRNVADIKGLVLKGKGKLTELQIADDIDHHVGCRYLAIEVFRGQPDLVEAVFKHGRVKGAEHPAGDLPVPGVDGGIIGRSHCPV